jgi:hypothetical protein
MFEDLASAGFSQITANLGQPNVPADYTPYLESNRRRLEDALEVKTEDVEREIVELMPPEDDPVEIVDEVPHRRDRFLNANEAQGLADAVESFSDEEWLEMVRDLMEDEVPDPEVYEVIWVKRNKEPWKRCPLCPVFRDNEEDLVRHMFSAHNRKLVYVEEDV